MEVPRPGIKSELQLLPVPQLRQSWILNLLQHSGLHFNVMNTIVEFANLSLFFFNLFGTALLAYGGSQARGPIGAIATSHSHTHSSVKFERCLRPTPQLTAMPDP